ncbi:MAG: hypothetical protein AAF564_22305 [Bacteroidota bacterium]
MSRQVIKYRSGFKYQLVEDYTVETGIEGFSVGHPFFTLTALGDLTINAGYAWDGASGPALDTNNFMRPSLVHDCGYQMMGEGLLPRSTRKEWDLLLRAHCLQDGMTKARAWWVYRAVRFGGDGYGRKPKQIKLAPKRRTTRNTP